MLEHAGKGWCFFSDFHSYSLTIEYHAIPWNAPLAECRVYLSLPDIVLNLYIHKFVNLCRHNNSVSYVFRSNIPNVCTHTHTDRTMERAHSDGFMPKPLYTPVKGVLASWQEHLGYFPTSQFSAGRSRRKTSDYPSFDSTDRRMSAVIGYSGWDKRYSSPKEGWEPISHLTPPQVLPYSQEFYQFHHQITRKPEYVWQMMPSGAEDISPPPLGVDRLDLNVDRQTVARLGVFSLGQSVFFVATISLLIYMTLPALQTPPPLLPFPVLKVPPYLAALEGHLQPQPLPADFLQTYPHIQNHPRCGITTGGQVWMDSDNLGLWHQTIIKSIFRRSAGGTVQ